MQIPLFPLHTVLAPGIALPLHIFEDRYRAMVRRCLDTSTPFGIVLIRQGSEVVPRGGGTHELSISGVGTFAEIREASKYLDGRWDLLTVGTGRFVVRQVIADQEPYLVGEVEELDDSLGDAEEADALVTRVTRRFVDYLRLLQPREGEEAEPIDVQVEVEVPDDDEDDDAADDDPHRGIDEDAEAGEGAGAGLDDALGGGPAELAAALHIPDDPSQLSFLLTGIVQVEPEARQRLLEATSAEARLRQLDALLDRELVLLRKRLAPYQADRRALLASAN
ncbi:MAG TPA: LON peptidase substrate-binding domain-containing protein [Candidatus Limnocylindrales bacterium]|nr:LON peptidase substrate-binding domain-containing protein [Candidatus Limnocylindrales bacterium]